MLIKVLLWSSGLFPLALAAQPFQPVETIIHHSIGDDTVILHLYQYGDRNDIRLINLHDNETTSVEAAQQLLRERGGTLVKIDNNGERLIQFRQNGKVYRFDPNRIFSAVGLKLSLKRFGQTGPRAEAAVKQFADKILTLLPAATGCVVALHNNTDGHFSVTDYLKGHVNERDAREVHLVAGQDPDDFFMVTDERSAQQLSASYNTVLQDNKRATQDGSLSVYYGEKNKCYVNCETQHGKPVQYKAMLEKTFDLLGEKQVGE